MARNPSPTTELSLSFEALRLNHEKKKEEEDEEEEAGKDFISSQIINQSGLEWRENSSRTDQSNLSYATGQQECHSNHLSDDCNHDNTLRDVLTPPTSCLCDCHNSNKVTCLSCDCHTVRSPDIGNQVLQNQSEVGGVIGGAVGGAVLSCRQEALYYNDVSVEELAGYFDELLHIPKPMSVMAELMYT